jgi:hypothetical protein
MPVPDAALKVTGDLQSATLTTSSGGLSTSYHCSTCLGRIYSTNTSWPEMAILRAGTLDASENLQPGLHIFVSTMQPWLTLPDGVPSFETVPPEGVPALLGL